MIQLSKIIIEITNVDITSKNAVRKLASDVKKKFGRIDGLINNAFLNHAKNQAKNGNKNACKA